MTTRRGTVAVAGAALAASGLVGCAAPLDAPTVAGSPAAATWWRPTPGLAWHLQLIGTPTPPPGVDVVDLDGADTPAATIRALTAAGAHAVCYLSAGSLEAWRADAGAFPDAVMGQPLDGWPGERWLDVRRREVLLPLMAARMDACAAKGFRAVDPDNVDGYGHLTGFDLTEADAAAYVRALAALAHERGLAIGLKNAVEVLPAVEDVVDFAVNEECATRGECGAYAGFVASGRPVFQVEYTDTCPAVPPGHSVIVAAEALDGPTMRCA